MPCNDRGLLRLMSDSDGDDNALTPPCKSSALCSLQSYRAKITYLPDASRASSFTAKHVCKVNCELCSNAGTACPAHTNVFVPGDAFEGLPGAHPAPAALHLRMVTALSCLHGVFVLLTCCGRRMRWTLLDPVNGHM